jgi:hypothetical protein
MILKHNTGAMTRTQKLQFLSAVQAGKIDTGSMQQMATYFILPSTETKGNWRVITGNSDVQELTAEQYKTFIKKAQPDEPGQTTEQGR